MMRPFFALQKALAVVVAGMFLLSAVVTAQEHTNEHAKDGSHSWSYSGSTGPEHWGDLSPEFAVCKTGKRQSPIDINHPPTADLPAIHIENRPAPLKIINTGHYITSELCSGQWKHHHGRRPNV